MVSVNKAILLGRVGKDPESKQLTNTTVTHLTIATTETWKDANGEKKEDTQWHSITVWGKQAENVARYVNKGDLLYIEGKITTECYEKDGSKRYSTKIIAREIKFLTSKKDKQQDNEQSTNQTQKNPANNPLDDIPF